MTILDPDACQAIIDHMNADHEDALCLYAQCFANTPAAQARMLGIDARGMDILVTAPAESQIRVDFPEPLPDTSAARSVLVAMVKQARETLG